MAQPIDTRLLTCRYWALGPQCPNVDIHGIEMCDFAHRDTGVLAGSYLQRGTCRSWLAGGCYYGNTCNYEHRHTGVFGLWQGVLPLSSPDLAIANKAFASGFNTGDHEALMNLIWSTKRVEMQNNGPSKGDRPPIHPIYPDRYRPSGVGDNTKRKRRKCPGKPYTPVTDSPPPFHPIPPLGFGKQRKSRKKKKKKGKTNTQDVPVKKHGLDRVLGSARISKPSSNKPISKKRGSQSNPIDLLSDSEDDAKVSNTANTSAKRQTASAITIKYKVEIPAITEAPKQDISELNPASGERVNTTLEITSVLNTVKSTLEHLQISMDKAKTKMSSLFSRNRERLGGDEIFPIMNKVAQEIYRSHDAARDAAIEVDRAVGQLEGEENAIDVGAAKEEIL